MLILKLKAKQRFISFYVPHGHPKLQINNVFGGIQ